MKGLGEMSAAIRERLSHLKERHPKDVEVDAVFDFTANLESPGAATTAGRLLLDVELPSAASADRTLQVVGRC
jgi:hypothetical protein